MNVSESALLILALVLMSTGTLLSLVPLLPGPLLVWGIGLIYALLNDFERVTYPALAIMTLLMIAGTTSEYWMQAMGVRSEGGSCLTTLGSIAGGILGSFLIPIPLLGTIAGMVIGALAVEYMRYRDIEQAKLAGRQALTLYLWSMVAEFAASAGILLVFVISVWATG